MLLEQLDINWGRSPRPYNPPLTGLVPVPAKVSRRSYGIIWGGLFSVAVALLAASIIQF